MIFKILCSVIVVLGFGYGGFYCGERLKKRLRQLEGFCDGLSALEFNIRYMNFPLWEAFEAAGKSCRDVVGRIFCCCGTIMQKNRGKSADEAFFDALKENSRALCISKEEQEILLSFSKSLGDCDCDGEISNIKTAKLRLNASLEDTREETLKKVKMSRSMGFLLGAFIVIVLI